MLLSFPLKVSSKTWDYLLIRESNLTMSDTLTFVAFDLSIINLDAHPYGHTIQDFHTLKLAAGTYAGIFIKWWQFIEKY